MYGFVTHTWNPIKGKCSHDCDYCYMKRWGEQKPLRLAESELKDDLGAGNFIFVGSSTDMFAEDVPTGWIVKVLDVCKKYQANQYLFQSKNPARMVAFNNSLFKYMPENVVLATTIETTHLGRNYKAPCVKERAYEIKQSKAKVMITIEPIMDFKLPTFVDILKEIKPWQVAIGADSGKHNLPEPSKEDTLELIKELRKFTNVVIKPNLKRIAGD